MEMCDYFWGTHACDLPAGHDGLHRCQEGPPGQGFCSEFDGIKVRFAGDEKWRPTGSGRIRDVLDKAAGFTEHLQ